MKIDFPRNFIVNKKSLIFIGYLWGGVKKTKSDNIILDFSTVNRFDLNFIGVLSKIISKIESSKSKLTIILKDYEGTRKKITCNHINEIISNYSRASAPISVINKYFSLNINNKELEEFLGNELININYKHKKKLVKVISELIENVNMHGSPKEVYVSGYYNFEKDSIMISIFNTGLTIKQNIEKKSNYKFENDKEAILWAIKKSNSTRSNIETGGLGLYFTRKYLCSIGGSVEIVSGKGIFKENKYNFIYDINLEEYSESDELKSFIPGTLITLVLKYEEYDSNEEIQLDLETEFEVFMEEMKIEYTLYN